MTVHPPDPLASLRAQALAGDEAAVQVLADALCDAGPIGLRFVEGDTAGAWSELVALGPAVFEPSCYPEAWGIAWETMRRVRRNVEALLVRYAEIGYRLARPEGGLGRPAAPELLDRLEREAGGPIPLSMRAFWEVVGSLDLRQAQDQTVHDWFDEPPSDLERLGDDDPLYVESAERVIAALESRDPRRVRRENGRLYVYFAPDCFHKANVSGGENYHLWVPDPRADFEIVGDVCPMTDDDAPGQRFVDALRRSLQGGGFRGRLDYDDESRWLPWRPLHEQLGRGLLPI